MKSKSPRNTKEREILKPLCDFLELYHGTHWAYIRNQHVKLVKVGDRLIPGRKRPSQNGLPDIFMFPFFESGFYAFECKRHKDGIQSKDQKKWEVFINRSGGNYYLVESVDLVIGLLKTLISCDHMKDPGDYL